jgi:hypothetical protein
VSKQCATTVAAVTLAFLLGCSSDAPTDIELGMTLDEVLDILGEPRTGKQYGNETWWGWAIDDDEGNLKEILVVITADGRVIDINWYPDN